jgi:3-dehydroquinate dehydratase/shikimate dehydrogenase
MICVSIGRSRHRHMMAEHKHLVESGARFVELRLDWIAGEVNLKRLLGERPCPVLLSIRREVDGGKWVGNEQKRIMLLRTAIAEGVDYIDLEEDNAR